MSTAPQNGGQLSIFPAVDPEANVPVVVFAIGDVYAGCALPNLPAIQRTLQRAALCATGAASYRAAITSGRQTFREIEATIHKKIGEAATEETKQNLQMILDALRPHFPGEPS